MVGISIGGIDANATRFFLQHRLQLYCYQRDTQGQAVGGVFASVFSRLESHAAALLTGRKYVGIEFDAEYFNQASARLARVKETVAAKRLSPFIPTLPG